MYKIDNDRRIALENGLIEVDRFPRNWKIGANQLWNLGRDVGLKLVRVMDQTFQDARVYKAEAAVASSAQSAPAPPPVLEQVPTGPTKSLIGPPPVGQANNAQA